MRRSGILAHPTSFPSAYGIGDLGQSAYDWVDFLQKAKQQLWQVLPLGPTSFGDSPYQSFSTFAGNQLLISPDILAEKGWLSPEDLAARPAFSYEREKLYYGEVIEYKDGLYRKAFANFSKTKNAAFLKFCKDNAVWLNDFALFTAIKFHFIGERRYSFECPEFLAYKATNEGLLSDDAVNDYFYGAVWNSWPQPLVAREPKALKEWTAKLAGEIAYLKFLQFEFFEEWAKLKAYANKKGIEIIGDIPIFVAMDSADVWANKDLFCLDALGRPTFVAGVPPDYFCATGQLWGNPLYNWPRHKETGFAWWVERVGRTLSIVDILRIDHFRGFDEYWSVKFGAPTAETGKWLKGPGRALFLEIEKKLGSLPIIAEDLGFLTESVTKLRLQCKLPGMKILQFAFDDAANVYLPHNFPDSNTVVYTGTHDNDTTNGWYASADEKERDYFRRYMNTSGDDPAWDLIRLAESSSADTAIVPLQDVMSLGTEHRMNTPGIASGNWQFRYTEEMLREELAERLAYLTELFGREAKRNEEFPLQPARLFLNSVQA